jgi:hypothetical protein
MQKAPQKAQTKDKIIGWISLISVVAIIIGLFLTWTGSIIVTILYIFGLSYCFYKTVVKKETLTKAEWIVAIILLFLVWVYPTLIILIFGSSFL